MERYEFADRHEFVEKLEEIVASGVPTDTIDTFTPYHVHETEHLLDDSQSKVRFFAGTGAVTGLTAGFAFTIYTVLAWPLWTGGKPLVSIPAFLVIGYELTILIGVLTAFVGFLALAKLPVFHHIVSPKKEFSEKFVIEVGGERRR